MMAAKIGARRYSGPKTDGHRESHHQPCQDSEQKPLIEERESDGGQRNQSKNAGYSLTLTSHKRESAQLASQTNALNFRMVRKPARSYKLMAPWFTPVTVRLTPSHPWLRNDPIDRRSSS